MTSQAISKTLVQERESTPAGQQGMAAARLAMKVRALMHLGLELTGVTQKALADRLGVGESRVSQILSGNGNIQISTFAKVMRGLGYKIELKAVPAENGVPALPERRARQQPKREKKMRTDSVIVTRGGSSGADSRILDFEVPADDYGAFYDVQSLHPTTRRPDRDKLVINWEEIDWERPVPSSRKEVFVGESGTL